MKHQTLTAILATFLIATGAAFAAPLADVDIDATGVYFQTTDGGDYQLTVSGPDGFSHRQTFNGSDPSFNLADSDGIDGTYVYELVAIPSKPAEADRAKPIDKRAQSGAFTVDSGSVVDPNLIEEGFEKAQVFATDLVVQGSGCVGFDCTSSESFGFDTLRLKENNLRIHFDDTSASASFPGNDWRLQANDSSNGGANYFSIEDATAGKTPFKVEAGAPNNTLYVEDDGDVGVGTANPVVRMHVVKGDSPTMRLEQDGSSGFTPQSWDLAGNETNFFVRDVTNGSKLPFRIKPGAPTDALFVAASGNIGLGTDAPAAALEVRRSDGTAQILIKENDTTGAAHDQLVLSSTGPTRIQMLNSGAGTENWRFNFANDGALRFANSADGGAASELELTNTGDMTITGTLTTGGTTCSGGCDLVFQPGFDLETIEEHAASMWSNSYLPSVGPTVENAPFNLSERTGGMLNELEKAHIYIAQLNDGLNEKDDEIDQLTERLARLEALMVVSAK